MTTEQLMTINIILAYYIIAGMVCGIYFLEVQLKSPEWEDKVRDFVWNTGLCDDFWKWAAFTISFVLGFYLLPYMLLRALGIIKKEK